MLKSNLCDFSVAYILVRGDTIEHQVTQVAFKSCAPFTKCIPESDGTTLGYPEDLDFVMPMHKRKESNSNYSETTGSLWFYYKEMKQLNLMLVLVKIIILNLLSITMNY